MAVISGFIVPPLEHALCPSITDALSRYVDPVNWPFYYSDAPTTNVGALVRVYPTSAPVEITGELVGSFQDDLYNRIHITPARLDLGNIVSTQTAPVTIWNAYLEPKLSLIHI